VNILFVIAEMAPLVKVGGVGDVGGSLPKALRRLGHDVRVALPFYKSIDRSIAREQPGAAGGATLWRAEHDGMPLYLLEHKAFDRDEVYGYDDDVARFLSFCDGLLANAVALGWTPDVVHMHDWHTGLLAARLASDAGAWPGVATVFTIHNLGYRGDFDRAFAREHGLLDGLFALPPDVPDGIAHSALAQGILHTNAVTTVSPTYAREIMSAEYGGAMAPLLRTLGDRLRGVMNGIDTAEYDPARDPNLAVNFDASSLNLRTGNKAVLQQKLGLPVSSAPLIGMVMRLFEQKAPDLAAEAIEQLLPAHDFQFAVLGTGAPEYEEQLTRLAAAHPGRVAVQIAFDYALGQQIYGGSDIFLMPSRYEPCGLGQMIAMRYGAVPVVRHTGGLADSVAQFDAGSDSGTGFLFDALTSDALAAALADAITTYGDQPAWRGLQQRGMAQDFSWDSAAHQYVALYERAISSTRSAK
jgi:starch synthase